MSLTSYTIPYLLMCSNFCLISHYSMRQKTITARHRVNTTADNSVIYSIMKYKIKLTKIIAFDEPCSYLSLLGQSSYLSTIK